jgi:hypothetical protein
MGGKGRRRPASLDEAVRVGEQFGLGALEGWTRERSLTIGLGRRSGSVRSSTCLYAGGVARVHGGGAEPDVLPWADATMMAFFLESGREGEPVPSVCECVIGGPAGLEMRLDDPVAGPAARAAYGALAARIAGAMVDSYNAGDVVAIGRSSRVDQQSITLPGGRSVAWADVSQVTLVLLYSRLPQPVPALIGLTVAGAGGTGQRSRDITLNLATVPNAAFFADVAGHAARHHGIPLRLREWGRGSLGEAG